MWGYIETAAAGNDGSIVGPIDVVLGPSNTFVTKPYIHSTPTTWLLLNL
jgi:hypothetical protein